MRRSILASTLSLAAVTFALSACSTPQAVRDLSAETRLAAEDLENGHAALYENLIVLAKSQVQSVRREQEARLGETYMRMRYRITSETVAYTTSRIDRYRDVHYTTHQPTIDAMNQEARDLYKKADDWPTVAAGADAAAEFQRLDTIHKRWKQADDAQINYLFFRDRVHKTESEEIRLFLEEASALRRETHTELDTKYEAASAKLASLASETTDTLKDLKDALAAFRQADRGVTKGTAAIDDYIQRKSIPAEFLSGFLHGLGLKGVSSSVIGAVDGAIARFADKANAVADGFRSESNDILDSVKASTTSES